MAKKTNTQEVALIKAIDETIVSAKEILVSDTGATPEAIESLKNTYEKAIIAGLEDMNGYKFIVQGAKDIKKMRTALSKRRKELTAPATKFQKEMIEKENEIIGILKPLEESLLLKKQDFEDKKQAEKNKLFRERCEQLDNHGYQLNGAFYICGAINIEAEKVADLTNDEFDFYLQQGQRELDRLKAERKRKAEEEARIKAEREAMAKEREELAKERAEFAKLKAELEAQKKALDETYKEIEEQNQPDKIEAPIQKPERKTAVNLPMEKQAPEMKKRVIKKSEPFVQPTEQTPQPKKPVEEPMILVGFNEMKKRVIDLANDKSKKLTRQILIEWAEVQVIC